MKRYLSLAALVAVLTVVAVGSGTAPLTPHAGAAAQDQQWGNVQGTVVWGADQIPARPQVTVTKDQDHCLAKGPILSDELLIDPKTKGVKNVFVWLGPVPGGSKLPIKDDLKAVPKDEPSIDQPMCMFVPRALVLREGQNLLVKNSSPVAHNVNWSGNPLKNPGGNVIVPAGGSHTIKDLKADRYPLNVACNIHPWMGAKVGVFDHPYFALTDANGKFEIKGAPAGEYRIFLWHEATGWRDKAAGKAGEKITIKPDGTDLGPLPITK